MWSTYKNPLNKEEMREYWRLHRMAFPEKYSTRSRRWRKNPEVAKKCQANSRKWRIKNRDYFYHLTNTYRKDNLHKYREYDRRRQPQKTIYTRNKRKLDLNFRLAGQLRSRMNAALKGKNKAFSTGKVLGCSIEDFKLYIESLFQSGMSWENYGRTGWHIDHIMPCAIFDLTKQDHQKRCFHFSNMQPLWAKDNLSKNKKHGYLI